MSPSLTGGWWRVGGRRSPVGPCHRPACVPPRQEAAVPCGRPAGGSPALPAPFCPRMGDTLPSTPTSPVGAPWGGSWTGHLGLRTRGAALSWRDGVGGLPSAPQPPLASSPPQVALLTALGARRGLPHPGHWTPQGGLGRLTGEAAGSEAEGEESPYCPRGLPGLWAARFHTGVCPAAYRVHCPSPPTVTFEARR